MSRKIEMKRHIISLLLFSPLVFPVYTTADAPPKEILEEVNYLAQARLDINNEIESLKYIGGPFLLKDYQVIYEEDPNSYFVSFDYQYKRPNEIEGCPDWFDLIVMDYDKSEWVIQNNNPAPKMEEDFSVMGDWESDDFFEVLSVLNAFQRRSRTEGPCYTFRYYEPNIVNLTSSGELEIHPNSKYGMYSLNKLGKNKAIALYNISNEWEWKRIDVNDLLLAYEYRDLLSDETYHLSLDGHASEKGWHLLLRQNGSYEPIYLIDYDTLTTHTQFEVLQEPQIPEEQQLKLEGKASINDLKLVIEKVKRINGIPNEPSAIQIEDGFAKVSGGSYLYNIPEEAVVMKKNENKWEIIRIIEMVNFDPDFNDKLEYLPLLEKPKAEDISEVVKRIKIDGSISKKDILSICELVMRIRNIDRNILSLKVIQSGLVEVTTGNEIIYWGNTIYFKKIDDNWIITEVGGYMM
ncbi:MAG: hypothetical protein ACYSUK_09720 [Planctomycetota bacterium]|jgi:hypothetical protein